MKDGGEIKKLIKKVFGSAPWVKIFFKQQSSWNCPWRANSCSVFGIN